MLRGWCSFTEQAFLWADCRHADRMIERKDSFNADRRGSASGASSRLGQTALFGSAESGSIAELNQGSGLGLSHPHLTIHTGTALQPGCSCCACCCLVVVVKICVAVGFAGVLLNSLALLRTDSFAVWSPQPAPSSPAFAACEFMRRFCCLMIVSTSQE